MASKTLKIASWTLIGKSRSTKETAIVVPELGLCFDMGYLPEEAVKQPVVAVSHGHIDHIACLHLHAFGRRTGRMTAGTYMMPEICQDNFIQLYTAFRAMSAGREHDHDGPKHFQIVTGDGGARLSLAKADCWLQSYPVQHRHSRHGPLPALGFCVLQQRSSLRKEYRGLPGKELAKLRAEGAEITESRDYPLVAFTGDTVIAGVLAHADLLNADLLIIECTFLESEAYPITPETAALRGHIHEQDLTQHAAAFQNKHLVLCHFSPRYSDTQIAGAVARLQSCFGSRLTVYAL